MSEQNIKSNDQASSLPDDFDPGWYAATYADVAKSGLSPHDHYRRIGVRLGRLAAAPVEPAHLHTFEKKKAFSAQANRRLDKAISVNETNEAYRDYAAKIADAIDRQIVNREAGGYFDVPEGITDTDYIGPITRVNSDQFISKAERSDTLNLAERMFRFGMAYVNPAPGIHSMRTPDGDLTEYASITSDGRPIETVSDRLVIHIHAYYPDVLEELLGRFNLSARHVRLVLTTASTAKADELTDILNDMSFSQHSIIVADNAGRDIGPFIDHIGEHVKSEDVVCHVHTKKSPDLANDHGRKWRAQLYRTLLTQTAVDAFADPDLGLLFPDFSRGVGWGRNKDQCLMLAQRLGQNHLAPHPGPIPVGNMFIARASVVRAMRDATKGTPWPREPLAYDGTILHAVERMWPVAAAHVGLRWSAIHCA